jgi:hypothetical protein
MRGAWFVILLAFASPAITGAQSVRGTVSLPDGSRAASGIIVVARDAAGTATVRALTDASGSFEIRVSGTGRYTLRALRIGHEPSRPVTIDVGPEGVAGVALELSIVPVTLVDVTVSARDECRVSPESGLQVSRVWQEARTALAAAQLNESRALDVDWLVYDRALDRDGAVVLEQEVTLRSERSSRAFRSASAAQLLTLGYVVVDGDVVEYFAPDAEVLLSDEFAGSHCLQLRAGPRGRESLIGVGFRPSRGRSGIRDIEGTFWIDRASAELRSLEYRYTGLPSAAQGANPGGVVEYARLPVGGWIVSRWSIRMPVLGTDSTWLTGGTRRVPRATVSVRAAVDGVRIAGGVVTRVSADGTVLFANDTPGLRLLVRASSSTGPAAGTLVQLEGTNAVAIADSSGAAQFATLLPGRYRALASSPLMDTLGLAPVVRVVDVRERAVTLDSILLPDARVLARTTCGRALAPSEGVLRGVVRDGANVPQRDVAVTASWIGGVVTAAREGAGTSLTQRALGTFSDSLGRWRICGVPTDAALVVRAASDAGTARVPAEIPPAAPMASVDLRIAATTPATTEDVAPDLGTGPAALEIVVTSSDDLPVVDARVTIEPPSGKVLVGRTNGSGRVLFPQLRPGAHTLEVRRLGFAPGKVVVAVGEGRNTAPLILDAVQLPALDTVRVVAGRAVSTRTDAFDTRRARGEATASIGAEEIARRKPAYAWQLLATVPAVRTLEGPQGVALYSSRVSVTSLLDPSIRHCWFRVAIDGVLLPGDPPNLGELPRPEDIHGIEVFAGAATIPLEYAGAGRDKWCGLLAVWTK